MVVERGIDGLLHGHLPCRLADYPPLIPQMRSDRRISLVDLADPQGQLQTITENASNRLT
jgi:hypothetical protein